MSKNLCGTSLTTLTVQAQSDVYANIKRVIHVQLYKQPVTVKINNKVSFSAFDVTIIRSIYTGCTNIISC